VNNPNCDSRSGVHNGSLEQYICGVHNVRTIEFSPPKNREQAHTRVREEIGSEKRRSPA